MGKFGINYLDLQIEEWRPYYINYETLKQKIEMIKNTIISRIQGQNTDSNFDSRQQSYSTETTQKIRNKTSLLLDDFQSLFRNNYGRELKEFINLLDTEIKKCNLFYKKMEVELNRKVNTHLYNQTNYINFSLFDIYEELHKLNLTIFFTQCLNTFIYDNMRALKKILKKFDKKLSIYCGLIQTKYIIYNLTLGNKGYLEYLLQYKIIDDSTIICDNNLKEIYKIYLRIQNSIATHNNLDNNKTKNNNLNNFSQFSEEYKNSSTFYNIRNKLSIDTLIKDEDIKNNNLNENLNNIENNEENKINNNNIFIDNGITTNNIKNKILSKRNEILEHLRDIEELTYFKIQHNDWFYFIKEENNKLTKHNERLLENDIFNPVLSSSYSKDYIIQKFLTNSQARKELKDAQLVISHLNKRNIILILLHIFFYNTYVTCIYPLLFAYIKEQNISITYSFITIALTYFCSYFSIIACYHNTKTKNIKSTYILSYILYLIGSCIYVVSTYFFDNREENETTSKKYLVFVGIICWRITLGVGENVMMGKKYITLYSPRFYVAKISKIYLFFQILGLAFGPFIGTLLLLIPEFGNEWWQYNYNNCIGWYGFISSFFLLFFTIILFTGPTSSKFHIAKNEITDRTSSNTFFEGDLQDTQDKEFYKMQHELTQTKNNENIENEKNDDFIRMSQPYDELVRTNTGIKKASQSGQLIDTILHNEDSDNNCNSEDIKINNNKNSTAAVDDIKIELKIKKDFSFNELDIDKDNKKKFSIQKDENPLFASLQNYINLQNHFDDSKNNDFNLINLIPRAVEDIMRKEKVTFGYINHNLLIMFFLLFFNNMVKENYIAYFSYFIIDKQIKVKDGEVEDWSEVQYTCFLSCIAYISELLSLFFITPYHKINSLYKIYLVTLMFLTNLLMISLTILLELNIIIYIYLPIITLLILANMIIEIVSSCYLSYLIPPGWKFKHIRAGALTFYIMTLGKILGCLFCLVSFTNSIFNFLAITIVVCIAYTWISIYILISPELRIKAICRAFKKKMENDCCV